MPRMWKKNRSSPGNPDKEGENMKNNNPENPSCLSCGNKNSKSIGKVGEFEVRKCNRCAYEWFPELQKLIYVTTSPTDYVPKVMCEICKKNTVEVHEKRGYETEIDGYTITIPRAEIGICSKCGDKTVSKDEYKKWRKILRGEKQRNRKGEQ